MSPDRLNIGLPEAQAFLSAHYGGDVSGVAPIGRGEWSRAYSFRRANRDYVIRFGRYREDFEKDQVAAGYATQALPIPRILELGEVGEACYAIAERVCGGYIDDVSGPELRALLPALFTALDDMRLADLGHTCGFGGWDASGRAPFDSWRAALLAVGEDRPEARTHGWRARLASSPVGAGPFDEAYACLVSLADSLPNERHLVHSDLLHWNVLVDRERITGVLDWQCSLFGDWVYDLAWLCFWQPWFPAWQGIDLYAEAQRHYDALGLHAPSLDRRLQACELHIGLDGQAYQAYTGRWDDLRETARATLAVARRASAFSELRD